MILSTCRPRCAGSRSVPSPMLRRRANVSSATPVRVRRTVARRSGGLSAGRRSPSTAAARVRSTSMLQLDSANASTSCPRRSPRWIASAMPPASSMTTCRLHQVAVAWRDALDGPFHRVDVRRDASAAPLARCVLCDLDVPDGQRWRRARQPRGVAERPHDGNGVTALVKRDRRNKLVILPHVTCSLACFVLTVLVLRPSAS